MRKFEGRAVSLEISGTSHGPGLSFILQGVPRVTQVDRRRLKAFMARRAPGGAGNSARKEPDKVEIRNIPGLEFRGKIANRDARPGDYGRRNLPRPGHADFPQWVECGRILSGGGDNSGRMTAAFCAAGFICLEFLRSRGISVSAKLETLHGKKSGFADEIRKARAKGDSLGGTIVCEVQGLRPGLGGALFDGLEGAISQQVFSIPGVRGVEFGAGFKSAAMYGSEFNDPYVVKDGEVRTKGNNHGGVLGGRATGMPLVFRVAMRPTPTISKAQTTVDLDTMKAAKLKMDVSRHDTAFVVRSTPIVEAAAAIALTDAIVAVERERSRICQVLTADTIAGMAAEYEAERYFTDMVELRVDLLKPSEISKVRRLPKLVPVPVVLTFRRRREGGAFAGSEKFRRDFFRRVLKKGCGFGYVDLEDDFASPELVQLAHAAGVGVIRSIHCDPADVNRLWKRFRDDHGDFDGDTADMLKFVVRAESVRDVLSMYERMDWRTHKPISVFATGRTGFFTRLSLEYLEKNSIIYATTGNLPETGMVTPHELVRDYGVRSRRGFFVRKFAVIGWPLDYTESPKINNPVFDNEGVNAVMVPVPCRSTEEVDALCRSGAFDGFAVTAPYKEYFAKIVANARPDLTSVNTVVFGRGYPVREMYGYSTDASGFCSAIVDFCGGLGGEKIAILGNGGASKAIQAFLDAAKIPYTVFHRRPLEPGFDVIINATPVDPIPEYEFSGREAVFDLGYRREGLPPLAARAKSAGCMVTDGRGMLRYQAEEQRRIFFSSR